MRLIAKDGEAIPSTPLIEPRGEARLAMLIGTAQRRQAIDSVARIAYQVER